MIQQAMADMQGFVVFLLIVGYFTTLSFYALNGYSTYFESIGGTLFMFFGEFNVDSFDNAEVTTTLSNFLIAPRLTKKTNSLPFPIP